MGNKLGNWFNRTRAAIEQAFAQWGHICFRHPWLIIVSILAAIIYVSTFLPTIKVDTSTAGFLHEKDPVRITYDRFQHEFSRDEKIVVIIEGDVFSIPFLEKLSDIHEKLGAIPQVAKVDSLVNARNTFGQDDELIVRDLLEDFPETAADIERIRQTVLNNPMFLHQFVNEELDLTTLIITTDNYSSLGQDFDPMAGFGNELAFEDTFAADDVGKAFEENIFSDEKPEFITGEEVGAIVEEVDRIIAENTAPGFAMSAAGSPHMMHLLTVILGTDMVKFSMLGILIISLFLALLFRRVVMVFLPILVAMLSTYTTIALMAFLGITITTSIQILPSFLLAVGVGNSVHIFTAFFQGIDQGKNKEEALSYALGHSGLAVLMTGLTTAGGLLSFVSAEIKPVSDFGFITPMGIMCALLFTLVLLPALIRVFPIREKALKDDSNSLNQAFLQHCATISTEHPKKVVLAWACIILPCLYSASTMSISHFPLNWFPEDNAFRVATEKMGEEMGGSSYMEVIIDTGEENGIHDPKVLHAMDKASQHVMSMDVNHIQPGKVISIVDINKELHQALNNNNPGYYKIPDDKALIAQELLLFENSGADDLEEIVDTLFSKTRMTIKVPFNDATTYPPFLDQLEHDISEIFDGVADVTFTGVFVMMARTVVAMLHSTVNAYIIAFCIITPLMIFLVGSLRTGLISMIPNLAPIIITLGMMPVFDIPLDAFTLLIGSIALGLAVDDTIHFMHNFQRFYAQSGNSSEAVHKTLKTTGQALLFTSLVLSSAFFVNMFATMVNLFAFGLLTGFCILVAFLADVILAPALVTLLIQYKERRSTS